MNLIIHKWRKLNSGETSQAWLAYRNYSKSALSQYVPRREPLLTAHNTPHLLQKMLIPKTLNIIWTNELKVSPLVSE